MKTRNFGDFEVPAIGLGCMAMSEFYGPGSEESEAIATIHRALEIGVTLLDTADMYGPFINEELLGRALRDRRDQAIIATKCGIIRTEDGGFGGVSGKPDYVRSACDASLRRLGVETIDLYQLHRPDPDVPIEETVGAMGGLIEAGKVLHIGLSEVGPKTLRRAHATVPITSLQTEYSLATREAEAEVLPTCRELGIGFLAYSPVCRGLLTGRYRSRKDFAPNDSRQFFPRFADENIEANLKIVDAAAEVAGAKGCTIAQLALAWLLAQGDHIVPIPGTRSIKRLEENAGSVEIELTQDELDRLDQTCPPGAAQGDRYPEGMEPVWD